MSDRTSRRPRRSVSALLLVLLIGCGGGPPTELDAPIVFIGIDSADWTWIDPALEDGRMPHLRELLARGVRAPLLSLKPAQKSPTIWTSIATGKRPVKHGIADFITHEKNVQTSEMRTAATYWEILGQLQKRQAVIGWWITFPATPVNGVMVSDFLPYFDHGSQQVEGAVDPPEIWAQLEPQLVRAGDIDDELLGRFVDLELAREHGEEAERLLADLRAILAADETYRRVARHLYAESAYDVFTVYFRGLDMASHKYWRWFEPQHSGIDPQDWRVRMLGGVIGAYYAYVDELIGEIVEYADPRSRFMVASDHGFVGHRRRSSGSTVGVGMHRDHGILALAGPGIRRGISIEEAEVKDLMPTLLAMSGIPLAQDLDGHLLGSAFEAPVQRYFDELITHSVPSYEGIVLRQRGEGGVSEEMNEEILEQLRSLGYIE